MTPTPRDVQENQVTVKVKLSADPERTVTIPINKAEQSGASDQDYSGVPENLTFNSGETEKTFVFSATADSIDDDGENIQLNFGTPLPPGVSASGTTQTTISITDDDLPLVTVSFEQGTYTASEGGTATIKVKLSADPERNRHHPRSTRPTRAGRQPPTTAAFRKT